jgi:hypothetical protein
MQAVVTIRLYDYMDRNTLNKGERDELKVFKDTSARACD